jgi:hypothetical protein
MAYINAFEPLETEFCVSGKMYTVRSASVYFKISTEVILWRISRNKHGRDIVRHEGLIEYNGKQCTYTMLADKYGLNPRTVASRWQRGLRGEELIEPVAPDGPLKAAVVDMSDERKKLKMECKRHLNALKYHHNKEYKHNLIQANIRLRSESFGADNIAAAQRNAWKFERQHAEVRSNGHYF